MNKIKIYQAIERIRRFKEIYHEFLFEKIV